MDIIRIDRDDPRFPVALIYYLGQEAPVSLSALGNLELLGSKKLALFCSVKCPGNMILQAYDFARSFIVKDNWAGQAAVGGFHSPIEKECLRLLLQGRQPIIMCPARSVEGMRLSKELNKALTEERLLILSPFDEAQQRATVETALVRNRLVAALAERIFVAYAEPQGKTEQFCREVMAWGKPLYTLDDDANRNLLALGAKPIGNQGLDKCLDTSYNPSEE
ncbi:MAG: DNA-processing protein DprA [Dehalococcoidia bacterium]|nr:DNA-processing protein DprA [Dehalococcoidia bacterium]